MNSDCMSHSYNNPMPASAHPRLDNLLAALSLGLADEGRAAMERARVDPASV